MSQFRFIFVLYIYIYICVCVYEGTRRTETSYFLLKSLEIKCQRYIFLLFAYIYT